MFIKTKYILEHKEKFNAFLFGSSRMANLPLEGLPKVTEDGTKLNWYNMTYAMGAPEENYNTIKTFVEEGVKIDELIIMIDEISMWKNATDSLDNPIYSTYQTYQRSPLKFFYSYIKLKPVYKLLPDIIKNDLGLKDKALKELFYDYGVDIKNTDLTIGDDTEMYDSERSLPYSEESHAVSAMEELVKLCEENNIKLVVITTPILESTYREGVENGYLDFLTDVSEYTEFYLFSGLNEYTTRAKYYFDSSHFKPYVGLEMEKVLFADEEIRNEAIKNAESVSEEISFGMKVNSANINEVVAVLRKELE
ncbi:hypothetical protein [Butyrivibrio sp. YAB3001]|uniref:hypothetical protein n=1 Tax=Butyrivibrio sp. YAB3001 TaxID=1520812 RepID=UPI0008F68096|nr:hypothetical protein [Butyrivibrio sp. YAB3001]SFB70840.1 hypothetical protein SAMN02910398_00362 [Butyrivibrio sp. YAB3001]